VTLILAVTAAVIGVGVMLSLPVPYILETPGPTVDTLGSEGDVDLIQVDQEPTHEITGELRLTTVGAYGSDYGSLSVFELVKGYFDADDAIIPYELVYPRDLTAEEREAESAKQMSSSQDAAVVAAFEYLDLPVGVLVKERLTDSAKAAFEPGDRLVAVAGEELGGYSELSEVMAGIEPGSELAVEVVREGVNQTVTVTTSEPESGEGSMLGIGVEFDFPVEVTFGLEDIGGPSAGSMFALGIIDKLGPEDLAGGLVVAGTGTVDPDGSIGAIGGIRQKMIGAKRDGAAYFLAPATNCDEAQGHAPAGLQVVKVSSLDDAVTALAALRSGDGDSLPSCG
jgi:PDZ domain-containing protein